MSKIRALNEESTSSESEDETNRKLSKEAQEEQAKQKYNHALKTLVKGQKKQAAELLEELLADPCLYPQQDDRQCSPFQQQLLLGCLKILGDLYREGELKNLERAKHMLGNAISIDQEENINLWYRLGKISYEAGDLYLAHDAFAIALYLRPTHWGCLENVVTISYATNDYISCLHYCAEGLIKDPCFIKGLVFRDLVYKIFPEMESTAIEKIKHGSALSSTIKYQQNWKDKYVEELRLADSRWQQRIDLIKSQVVRSKPKIHLNLPNLSLVEVVKSFLQEYEAARKTSDFHETVELTWSIHASTPDPDEQSGTSASDELQPSKEEESQTGLRRSRSSSDEKDNTNPTDGEGQPEAEEDSERLTAENSQPLDSQSQGQDADAGNKKKHKRDVKWWQMEGKRRSQRVRGHLMPTSPDKAKKESSFADQLKNLIPASLLNEDGLALERECTKQVEKCTWQKKLQISYFGTKEEDAHVKQILAALSGRTLPSMLIFIVQFLVNNVKCPWPLGLREFFLSAYSSYRSHMSSLAILNLEPSKVITEAYACLCFMEIFVEMYRIELNIGDLALLDIFNRETLYFEECVSLLHDLPPPHDLFHRIKWLRVRRLLQTAKKSDEEHTNHEVCLLLSQMETDLRKEKEPVEIWTVNESANLICLESVTEKAAGIAKMRNSQVVTDMFQNEQYESLIGILQSCINFSEIEKRDLSDIYYYTIALFRLGMNECIFRCLNLMSYSVRFQDSHYLSESLLLLEEIWGKMRKEFSLQDKKMAVSNLIKILVSCERKPPTQEAVVTIPWCLLHSIMFSLEREEPTFYLEEDIVPNSVLLLQMAHECMSRSDKCCMNNGRLLLYTMKAIVEVKKQDEYMAYEETRHCMEQAIFCLYSHPSKKSKIKYLKDHNSTGIPFTWDICPTLFQYYYPDEMPEFDSYASIGGEVESLFQRMLHIMPTELRHFDSRVLIEESIESGGDKHGPVEEAKPSPSFPDSIRDIYYLMGDYHFKNRDLSISVDYYIWDLALNPRRFDSWAGIALCLAENINTTLNTADEIIFTEMLTKAQSASYCFSNALKIDSSNMKLRIEFGSFVYAMHAYCSRLMKQESTCIDMDLFSIIEKSQEDFLQSAFKCFEPTAKGEASDSNEVPETVEDEQWIHHYMLGKIYEKLLLKDGAEQFLKQYELAGELLHEQGAPYPSKMNYYSPPEFAIEALEIYYRIHATILNMVENSEYSLELENTLVQYIRRQEESPFVKCKLSRGEGDGTKKSKKAAEDAVSKKDMADISALMKDMLDKAENMAVSKSPSSSSASEVEEESSTDSQKVGDPAVQPPPQVQPPVSSFSLSEFQKLLQEKEQKIAKSANESKTTDPVVSAAGAPGQKKDIYEGLHLENNRFYKRFKHCKFGNVIALCLKAMEECIARYPYHYKAYFRLAHSYVSFLKDAKTAKDYLMGSAQLSQRKINGLFGERKTNNFFNGIWRNPIDDIDRPGSFSYHMNKTMQLLLDVLTQLHDHSLLADIVLLLAKVPDNEKKYLSNPDREMFCLQAFNAAIVSAKKRAHERGVNYNEVGIEIFETYQKLQKHSPRMNTLPNVLYEVYKLHFRSQVGQLRVRTFFKNLADEGITVDHAIKYYSFQYTTLKASLSRTAAKAGTSQGSITDQQRSLESVAGGGPRRRGRKTLRQPSQDAPHPPPPPLQPGHFEFSNRAIMVEALSSILPPRSMMDTGTASSVQRANGLITQAGIDLMKHFVGPPPHIKSIEGSSRSLNTPPLAHEPPPLQASPMLKLKMAGIAQHELQPTRTMPLSLSSSKLHKTQRQATPSPNNPKRKLETPKLVQGKQGTSSNTPSPNVLHSPTPIPSNPPQPIRINTSPFKSQTTAIEQPPQFLFRKQKDVTTSSTQTTGRYPPLAHSNFIGKKRPAPDDSDSGSVHVIDLTVKSPEKDKEPKESSSLPKPIPVPAVPAWDVVAGPSQPVLVTIRKPTNQRPQPSYPLPPKKKLQQMFRDSSSVAVPTTSPQQNPCVPGQDLHSDVEVITLDDD